MHSTHILSFLYLSNNSIINDGLDLLFFILPGSENIIEK